MSWLRRYVQFKWDNHLSRKRGLLPRQERDAITYMLTAGKYPTYDDYLRDEMNGGTSEPQRPDDSAARHDL